MPASAGDVRKAGSIPGLGRFPGGGHATHCRTEGPGGPQSTGSPTRLKLLNRRGINGSLSPGTAVCPPRPPRHALTPQRREEQRAQALHTVSAQSMCKHGPTGVSFVPCRVSCSPHPRSGDFLYVVSLQICYNPVIPVQSEWDFGLFPNRLKKKKKDVFGCTES